MIYLYEVACVSLECILNSFDREELLKPLE